MRIGKRGTRLGDEDWESTWVLDYVAREEWEGLGLSAKLGALWHTPAPSSSPACLLPWY